MTRVRNNYSMSGNYIMRLISLIAQNWLNNISGISLLDIPTEVYVHGTSYLFIGCAVIFVGLVMSIVFLPAFHDLKLTSTYEYLEKRFDKRIRLLGSILFAIGNVSKSSRKRIARINLFFTILLSRAIQIYMMTSFR